MAFLVALLTLALIALVILVVAAPLRRERHSGQATDAADLTSGSHVPRTVMPVSRIADLEAAREAKYREIRDAELDFRTGKLSREDYEMIDADLRAEAIEILNDLEPLASASASAVADGDGARDDAAGGAMDDGIADWGAGDRDSPDAGLEAGN